MTEKQHFIIALDSAGDYRREQYGVLYQSRNVFRTSKSHSPTRVVVWDNTGRPNPDNGKRLGDTLEAGERRGNRVTQYSLRYTNGKFLNPHNNPTDAPVTVLLSTESTAITSNGTNTGTVASGQVYDNRQGIMRDGDLATLLYPDGTSAEAVINLPAHNNGHGFANIYKGREY